MLSTADGLRLLGVNDAFVAVTGYAAQAVVGQGAAQVPLYAKPAQAGKDAELTVRIQHAIAGNKNLSASAKALRIIVHNGFATCGEAPPTAKPVR